jgi:hypothetical protein
VIRYLPHAEEAMAKRGISLEWVADALATLDWTDTDPRYPERHRSFKAIAEYGGWILRVVHCREGSDIVVPTVHPDRDAKKRLRRT